MCGFIAQLVEQRTGNAEVTGSNPVCLNWEIYCDDHSSLLSNFTMPISFYLHNPT